MKYELQITNYELIRKNKIKIISILFLSLSLLIIAACADANKKLFDAIEKNDIETVKTLIANGMDLNVVNDEGKPAVILAVELKRRRIAEMMLKADVNCDVWDDTHTSLFMWVCNRFEVDLISQIVDKGGEINDINDDGMTPLMFASQSGYIDAILFLLKSGAYINAQNKDGNTALMLALKNKMESIISLFVDNKSLLDIKNNQGETPLIIAVEQDMEESVSLFLENNADKSLKDNKGRTALSIAQKKGNKKIIEMLTRENPK